MFEIFHPQNLYTTILYITAAVLPAIVLMSYVYRMDRAEKEPSRLLGILIVGGVLSALAAMFVEIIAETIMQNTLDVSFTTYQILDATMVGLAEEGCKLFFLKKYSWNSGDFNYRFDGVVYAVFVSLGFAAFENILYVFMYGGLSVALQRAILTVPAHMGFAVYMGIFYGRAKIQDVRGKQAASKVSLWIAYLVAVFLHAFYDGTLMVGTDTSFYLFIGFVVVMYVIVFQTLKKHSQTDESIY